MEYLETHFDRQINLHPEDHLPSSLTKDAYDIIIIGSGPSGRNCAARASAAGASCLVVESQLYGGDCPYWACVPSKAILRPGEALDAARAVGGARELISDKEGVDAAAVFARRDGIVQNWNDKFLIGLSEQDKVDVVRGAGKIVGPKEVSIDFDGSSAKKVKARFAVVISTGSEPKEPPVPGLLDTKPWTPRHAVSANVVPEHLIIMGAGVVGCEMATAYTRLGSRVTLICGTRSILPNAPSKASELVSHSLAERGAKIVCSRVEKVEKTAGSNVKVHLANGDAVEGSKILVATGRTPRTGGIGLDSIKISPLRSGALDVDESLCVKGTQDKWLYAIGDANGRSPLTHMGVYQSKIAADAIMARSKLKSGDIDTSKWSQFVASADHECTAQVIFTDPTIASVGLSLEAAKKAGRQVKEVTSSFGFPGAMLYGDDFPGSAWAQWIVDEERNVLVGATFVGRDATDLLHASTVAIVGEVPLSRLRHAVASFPTRSEIYTSLLLAAGL